MKAVLVGNKAIKGCGELIDSYPVVIRINGGIPDTGNKNDIGEVTSGWSFSTMSKAQYDFWREGFSGIPQLTLNSRCSYEFVKGFRIDNPVYVDLINDYQHPRPSTGLITAHYLVKHEGFELDLIGFDFFQSPTWYRGSNEHIPHNGNMEREYLTDLVGNVI